MCQCHSGASKLTAPSLIRDGRISQDQSHQILSADSQSNNIARYNGEHEYSNIDSDEKDICFQAGRLPGQ
jgi:hypothetical protein